MEIQTKNIEEFFLKVFKITILFIMAMSLLTILVLLATAAYQYSQSPKEPPPAQKAKVKDIGVDDLRKFLIDKEKQDGNKEIIPKQQPAGGHFSLRFLEESTALYRCAGEFGKKTGEEFETTNNEQNAKTVETLRSKIETISEGALRGEPWVRDALSFTCMALSDSSIIELKKEQTVKKVFMPIIQFHVQSWDRIQSEKLNFEQQEENRVAYQRTAEAKRVLIAKVLAVKCFIGAATAFALFMLLAFYLLFAKVENDLRDINETIREEKAFRAQ